MLFAVLPAAVELPPVWPNERAHPVLLVVGVVALVLAAVVPFGFAGAVHFVVLPVALVLAVVAPDVDA